MMRFAFYLLLLLAVTGAVVWGMTQGTGYVLITFDHFRYESTLWIFLGLLLGLWLLVVFARRLCCGLAWSAAWINPWSRRNRERRVAKASSFGQRELAEGRWAQALEHLSLAADNDSRPLVHYLGAARAANEMRHFDQCERLLERALTREPEAALAVGLTRAQLLIERGDTAAARDVLNDLNREFPKQPQIVLLLQKLYVQLESWAELCSLLPELRRASLLPDVKLDDLELLAWAAQLKQTQALPAAEASEQASAQARLEQLWHDMPVRLQRELPLALAYAQALAHTGQSDKALTLLASWISDRFDARLIDLYGQMVGTDSMQQLLRAESWLITHAQDSALLLALGRLSARNQLWDKARQYLEESLSLVRRAETCAELAQVLAQLGEKERSHQLFVESLALQERNLPVLSKAV